MGRNEHVILGYLGINRFSLGGIMLAPTFYRRVKAFASAENTHGGLVDRGAK